VKRETGSLATCNSREGFTHKWEQRDDVPVRAMIVQALAVLYTRRENGGAVRVTVQGWVRLLATREVQTRALAGPAAPPQLSPTRRPCPRLLSTSPVSHPSPDTPDLGTPPRSFPLLTKLRPYPYPYPVPRACIHRTCPYLNTVSAPYREKELPA
jgi:hypothetical protein